MTSHEEKKALPPAEVLPGGVFPDEIAAIKKRARGQNASRRLKIGIAAGSVILVIFAVVGGTFLGLHLNRKPVLATRSVKLAIADEIVEETVEVDKERDTEIFRTISSTGSSYVIRNKKRGLSAYRFDGDEKCYILYESLAETEDVEELLKDLEKMKEGEIEVAKRQAATFLTVDEARGQVDRAVLSESMAEFCEGLHAHWAVMSSSASAVEEKEASSTQAITDEENEAKQTPSSTVQMEATTLMELLSETNGTNREKRSTDCRRCCLRECQGSDFCGCSVGFETCERRCTRECERWGWFFRSGRCLRWGTGFRWSCRWVTIRPCNCQRYTWGGGGRVGGRVGGGGDLRPLK